MHWVDTGNAAIAGYQRRYHSERILVLNNLSESQQTLTLPVEHQGSAVDLMSDDSVLIKSSRSLQAYAYLWLKYDEG
jgi:hypothetical protein